MAGHGRPVHGARRLRMVRRVVDSSAFPVRGVPEVPLVAHTSPVVVAWLAPFVVQAQLPLFQQRKQPTPACPVPGFSQA